MKEASPRASVPPWELSRNTGPLPVVPADAAPEPPDGPGQADGDFKGLPRRVKQASIAPQLRGNAAARKQAAGATIPDGAGPSPEEIRATMSALQRGLQEGRSQSTEGDPDAT
jgi:hypothetical protein